MKPIQSFQDYRKYLEAAYREARENQPNLSLQRYSEKLGLGTSNFKMILSGARNLTTHHGLAIARALRMSPHEAEYFEALVLYDQAETSWEKAHYSRRLKKLKTELKTFNVRVANKTFLSDPAVPALLVYLSDTMQAGTSITDVDHGRLAKQFQMKPEKMVELLERLDREGMINVDETGRTHFVFDKMTHVVAQKAYLKSLMSEAQSKMESEYGNPESYFTAFTFSTTDENLQKLRADLQELMEQHMCGVAASKPGARMAQACFQVFPVSEPLNLKSSRPIHSRRLGLSKAPKAQPELE